MCKWWDDFLGDVEPLKLSLKAPDMTIERLMQWVDKQVAPSLATLFTAFNGDTQLIYDFIVNGMERMSEHQENIAKAHSISLEDEAKQREQDRKMMWDRYLFKTGAHREVHNKIEKVTAPHSDHDKYL